MAVYKRDLRMERNIRLYTVYRFFWGLLIIGPILVPFLLAKGMSYTQIMILQSISSLILAVSYLLPAMIISTWSVAIIGLQQIVRGVYKPTLNAYINRQVEDVRRATIISTVSLAGSLSFALVAPLVGLSLDHYGAITTYMLVGAVIAIGVIALQRRQTTE